MHYIIIVQENDDQQIKKNIRLKLSFSKFSNSLSFPCREFLLAIFPVFPVFPVPWVPWCYHCKGPFGDLGDLINHTRDEHQASQLRILVPWLARKDTSSSDIWNIQEVRVISDYIYKINKFWLVWWFGRICMPTNITCMPNIMTNHRIIARKYYEHQKIWNRFKMTIYKQSNL